MSDIIEELNNSPSILPFHEGYKPPTHIQIKAAAAFKAIASQSSSTIWLANKTRPTTK